jgi:hypothetical protein
VHTPGHAVLNLWLLGGGALSLPALPILAGAIAPDVPIVILYLRERYLRGLPEERIWRESYQRPFWLNLIHGAHSLPLSLAGALGGLALGSAAVTAFFASVFLHALADLPVHAEDAHRHFLPFSHYRLISPISYWDVRYHARTVALVEALAVCLAAVWLAREASTPARLLLASVGGWYLIHYARTFLAHAWRAFLP